MAIQLKTIHSFLVHPEKHKDEQSQIRGAQVPTSGRLFEMLRDVFEKSDHECTYDITFDSALDGAQKNECRDLIVAYLKRSSIVTGRAIAQRLQTVTTGKSRLGLLFLLSGKTDGEHKIVLSRFPADSAILAEESADSLSVQFLEKVFMKSATAYKAAVYRGKSLAGDFWDGKAVDKQINHDIITISNYWIKEFLASDFRATSAGGTKRLAVALLVATKRSENPGVKQEIVAAARLASGLSNKTTSVKDFCAKFHLSDDAMNAIRQQMPNDTVFAERFRFSPTEFAKHIAIQSVELNNGAILMAPASEFDNVFQKEVLNKKTEDVRYSTEGRVVDQKLRRKRR
jgi:hypothetical protein